MKKLTNKSLQVLVVFLTTLSIVTACSGNERINKTTNDAASIEQLAETAYLYGLQQVIFYGQRWIYTQNNAKDNISYSGVNRLFNIRKPLNPDSGFPVVTPNATTLYGTGFIDLQKEPLVIEMPEISDRYFSLQIMSQYGIFYTMLGNQFNGTKARKYCLLPVGYKGHIPADFVTTDVIHATSNAGYIFVRIAVMTGSDAEIKKINKFQDEITITPVSKWLANGKKGVPQSETEIVPGTYSVYDKFPKMAIGQVEKQTAEDYFTILNMALNDPTFTLISDSKKEAEFLTQLESIGVGKHKKFNWSALGDDTKKALENGFKAGYTKVKTTLKGSLINMNGWMEVRNSGGFETAWLDRAVMGDAGWAGPDKNVSHTGAFRFVDDSGNQLNSKNKYTITFDLNDMPPVSQFWSIPIYDKDGYFVNNEIDRFTVNSFMVDQGIFHTENNKLVIYVQKEKPSDAKQLKNWLPAPEGEFRFTARFYGPKMGIIDGSYKMPAPIKQ